MLRKNKKNNKNKNKFLLVFIIMGIILGIIISSKLIFSEKPPKDTTKVLNAIEQVIEVSTTKYTYSNIVTVTKDKSFKNIKIPFSEKSFIIKYNGIVKGGVTLTDIKILKNDRKSIELEIARCSIVDHYIDEENVYVYDIKDAIFNKLKVNEVFEELAKNKKEYEQKIIKEGFMNDVKSNTKKSLENSLKNLGYEEVKITFKG